MHAASAKTKVLMCAVSSLRILNVGITVDHFEVANGYDWVRR